METRNQVSRGYIARPAEANVAAGGFSSSAATPVKERQQRLVRKVEARVSSVTRLIGLRSPPAARFVRLMLMRRLGVEAEMQGLPTRADFFWRECHHILRKQWDELPFWIAGAGQDGMPDSDFQAALDYRQRLVEVQFIDTHIGFYNGRMAQHTPTSAHDRAFRHVAYATELAELAGYGAEPLKFILVPSGELQIDLHRAAGECAQALALCHVLLERFPDQSVFVDRLAALQFEAAVLDLSDSTATADCAREAKGLDKALAGLREDLRRYPRSADLYTVGAQLELIRAVKLANSGQLADALVAVKWAHAYVPGDQETAELEAQLASHMFALQKSSKETLQQLERAGNVTLTEEGQRLVAEAERGFSPSATVAGSPELATVRRLGEEARIAQADAVPDRCSWHADPERAPLLLLDQATPPAAGANREPLGYWLGSRQDIGSKAVAVCGLCVLVVAAVSAHQQAERRDIREQAYRALTEAVVRDNDDATIAAAESFLEKPIWGSDAREAEVLQRYKTAFTHWFVSRGHMLDGAARARVERFRRVAPTAGAGEVAP